MSKKKKVCLLIAGIAVVLLGAALIVYFALSTTYDIDESLIRKAADYRIVAEKRDGYMTLVKKDASGNISDEPIKVIGFTDSHFDAKKEKGNTTFSCMVRNIVAEQPDLVVFVGDTISAGFNRLRVRQLCKTMEKLGVYWACVLGNHEGDNPWSMSRAGMLKTFASYDHCLVDDSDKYTSSGEKVWGHGNYVINLADSKGNIYQSLYFLDGGSNMSDEDMVRYDAEFDDKVHNDYDYLKESQMQWYSETVADIERINKAPVYSTVFDHIPLIEYREAYEEITGETEACTLTPDCYLQPNANGTCLIMGQRRETICYSGHNSGFFDVMEKLGSTKLFVCGHDHINDFAIKYKGITLAYNVPSGYSSYNLYSKGISDKLMKGYSRYYFNTDGSFIMEQLYNADIYPEEQEAVRRLYD